MIKYLLFVQSLQMSMSNFNQYIRATGDQELGEDKFFLNFMGMNVLISVFSTMFSLFNAVLMLIVFQSSQIVMRTIFIGIIISLNIFCIIWTNFKFTDDIST
jgi:hypothetical protein